MFIDLRNSYRADLRARIAALEFREKRLPSVWAREMRWMPIGGPVSGSEVCRYDHNVAPHAVEIMDAADDPKVRVVVNWSAVRDSKTAICLNVLGRTVTDAPCGIYDVHPTDEEVAKFSNDDAEPMIDLCVPDYFVKRKSRDSGRTVNYKKYRGGSLRIVNAGSINKFRGSTVGVLFLHEVDGYADKLSIYKAINRAKGIRNAIIFLESTGTIAPTVHADGKMEYNSVIHEWHDKGDKRKWFCRCRACGELQWLKFTQIKAPDGDPRHAAYFCERCDEAHNERQWRKMVTQGKWYPTAGLSESDLLEIEKSHRDAKATEPEVRSYWRNGFNSLLPKHDAYATKLHECLAEGESAKTSREALRIWTNEIAAELTSPDDEAVEPPPWAPILAGREGYAVIDKEGAEQITVPEPGRVVVSMTDLHPNRLELFWAAFAQNEESWLLNHTVLFGDTQSGVDVWDRWVTSLQRKFRHASGAEMGLDLAFIDCGSLADPALATLRRLRATPVPGVTGRVRMSKGIGLSNAVIARTWATVWNKAKGVHIGTWFAKALIYERLGWHGPNVLPVPGFIHVGRNIGEEVIRQFVAERPVMKILPGTGREVMTFKNPEGSRNEGLDGLVGLLAAFRYNARRWDFEGIGRELRRRAAEKPKGELSIPDLKRGDERTTAQPLAAPVSAAPAPSRARRLEGSWAL